MDELLEWCDELAIPVVTIWALSMDNLTRQPGELSQLVDVIQNKLAILCQSQPGRQSPRSIHALGYDGREEITQAVRQLLLDKAKQEVYLKDLATELTSEDIAKWLYCKDTPDPDLIIRTSGELRLSGFLLWQSVYSELYFCDTLWPDFRKVDFLRALRSYQQRQRRSGR